MQGKFACNVLLTTKKMLTNVNRGKPWSFSPNLLGFARVICSAKRLSKEKDPLQDER
jgi:hypothetical protein